MYRSNVWLADGTFKCKPTQFGQLYVVLGATPDSDAFPACYCLLPNKQAYTYSRMFSLIKSKLDEGSKGPEILVVDFESAVAKGVQEVFPNVQVDGCNFHWKKVLLTM